MASGVLRTVGTNGNGDWHRSALLL
jgi:hypothetical protein